MTTTSQVTLTEASALLSVPIGTLKSWRSRGLIYPAGKALNPMTNRMVTVYELPELQDVKVRHATNT